MKFIINNDKLKIQEPLVINSGSLNNYLVEVQTSSEWDTLSIEAIICTKDSNKGISRAVINNQFYIDLSKKAQYTIGFIGYTVENNEKIFQKSTDLRIIPIIKGAGEIEPTNADEVPTLTEWETYLNSVQEFINDANLILAQANNLDVEADGEILTITKKDGTTKTVNIKGQDGRDGRDGVDGQDGYTPQKGIDYFTSEEVEEIKTNAEEAVLEEVYTKDETDSLLEEKADTEDIPDVSNFITKDVNNLTNYTTTIDMNNTINTAVGTETSARQNADVNIQNQIDAITSASDVVDVVSTYQDLLDYDTSKLTDKDVIKVMQDSTHSNALSYYRWLSNAWTYVGSEGPFYTKGETDILINEKYTKPVGGIPKTDLDSSVQTSLGKADTAIQEHQDLSDYVKNTDYATSSVGGVIKTAWGSGLYMSDGNLQARTITNQEYNSAGSAFFIGKGTLENVITGKQLINQTQLDENIEILQEENARLKQTLPTTTGAGETITLNKTAELDFVVPPLPRGNTKQDGEPTPINPVEIKTVSGDVEVLVQNENILNPYKMFENQINSGLIQIKNDGKIILNGTVNYDNRDLKKTKLKAGTYYGIERQLIVHFFWDGYDGYLQRGTYTLTEDKEIQGYLQNGTYNNVELQPMIHKGEYNSSISYTPHKEQKLPLYLPVENLFDKDNVTNGYLKADGTIQANDTFRVSDYINLKKFDNITISGNYGASELCCFYDSNKTFISSFGMATLTTQTVSVPLNAKYLRTTTRVDVLNQYQIEPGSKANHYTPYGTTPIELCKIGDYKDYPWKDLTTGKRYWHKRIREIVLDGTENWTVSTTYTNNTRFTANDSRLNLGKTTKLISNYFIEGTGGTDTTNIDTNGNTGQLMLTIPNNIATTTEGLAIWLSTHNTKVKYILEEPIDIEITDPTLINQLEAIYKAISYEGQTNISGTSSGVEPNFEVEAYQSIKLLLEE